MSKEDEIRARLAAAIEDHRNREREAQATRQAQAQVDQQDLEKFETVVEREIQPAFNSFKLMLASHDIEARVERPASGSGSPRRDVIQILILPKPVNGNARSLALAFSRANRQPGSVRMYDPHKVASDGSTDQSDILKYEDVNQEAILERLTTLFEQTMQRPG